MAISRMNMERQMRNMGGIMGLEDQRQGYFLGKLVKKITKPIKKVVKSPLGKLALGAAALKFGGPGIAKLLGRPATGFLSGQFTGPGGIFSAAKGLFDQGNLLAPLVRNKAGEFSLGRAALSGLGATAIAAPFFMGGDEEEVDEESFTGPISSIEDIRDQARRYYSDPTNSALYFMPPKSAVKFGGAFANGGLAGMRPGYSQGEIVEDVKEGIETVASDENNENMMMAGMGNVMKLFENYDGSFDRAAFEDMLIQYEDSGAKANGVKLMDFAVDFLGISSMKEGGRVPMQEGGLMDLGGFEKDYREGGFVPLGAEERADDVPARLSKNEFVFTADAVRNAGEGDIDKGAEVMQNMMDNLEAGGTISEESQGKENPAQEMFNQAQMLESRIA